MRKKISSDKMPWKKIVFDVSNCDGELLISLFSSMENVAIIEIGNQVEVIFPAGDWQKIFEILSNIERNPNLKLLQSIAENGSQSLVIFTSILTIESEFFARDVLNYGRAVKETMTKGEWIPMVVK